MKAIVKKKAEQGLWIDEVPIPPVGINDVLIKIKKTAICGTDVHIYNWDAWAQKTITVPMHVGHEFVGIVAEVGENVHDFRQGFLGDANPLRDRSRSLLHSPHAIKNGSGHLHAGDFVVQELGILKGGQR